MYNDIVRVICFRYVADFFVPSEMTEVMGMAQIQVTDQ